MKKFMFVSMIVFVFFMVACASTETAQNSSAKKSYSDMPCGEFLHAQGKFAALGQSSGASMMVAEVTRAALAQAQIQMATDLKGAYRGMVSDFMQRMGLNNKVDIESKLAAAGDRIIEAEIPATQPVCEKVRDIDENNIEVFLVIQTVEDDIAKKIAAAVSRNLTGEEKTEINYDEHVYREDMEKRMKTYKEEKQAEKENYKKSQEEKKQEEK